MTVSSAYVKMPASSHTSGRSMMNKLNNNHLSTDPFSTAKVKGFREDIILATQTN